MDDFGAFMAENTGKGVVIALGAELTLPSLEFDPKRPISLEVPLAETHLRMETDIGDAFSDQCVVGKHFRPIAPALPDGAKSSGGLKTSPLEDGLVTLDTSKFGPVKLAALMDIKWSKPLGADYLLQDLALSVHVKKLPEAAFLKLVAKAAGAYLDVSVDSYYIEADSASLHLRIKNTFAKQPEDDHPTKIGAKRHLYLGLLDNLADVDAGLREREPGRATTAWAYDSDDVLKYTTELRACQVDDDGITSEDGKTLDEADPFTVRLVGPVTQVVFVEHPSLHEKYYHGYGQIIWNADGLIMVNFPMAGYFPPLNLKVNWTPPLKAI